MRIALVAEDYYPQLGGVPEHVHNLALQFIQRGHQATIVTSHMRGKWPDPPFVRRVGTSVVIYANGGSSRVTVGRQLTRRLEALFRDAFDIIHVHGGLAPTFGLVAPRAAFRAGIPVVATFHSWFDTSPSCRIGRRLLQPMLSRLAATIAVSDAAAEAMARYFKANWEIIPNGVDLEFFHPSGRRQFAAGADGPRLLFLHRLEPRNHLGTVLEAMPAVWQHCPGAQLVVAGDGPWRRYYQRRAARLGPRITFVGTVFHDRPAYYRAADLYLCPRNPASFGITLLEAMGCGTPALVADNAGFRSVVKGGSHAMLLTHDDPAAWADAITALAADPGRRQAMSAAALARVGEYAWPVVADRILEVYRRVVQPSLREGQSHANAGSRTRTPCGTGS
jgi:phosphatidyl-myo-inositol alpha-mannosyltransferase